QSGELFIADHSANVVAELSTTGQLQVLAHVPSPANIAVTPDGKTVFVASPETGAVFTINVQTRVIDYLKGFASVMNPPACGASGPKTSGNICPAGLAADSSGTLFVSDANAGRILRVDSQSAVVTTIAA